MESKFTVICATLVAVAIVVVLGFSIDRSFKASQDKRHLNQARCFELIKAGQFLCSQAGSTQR